MQLRFVDSVAVSNKNLGLNVSAHGKKKHPVWIELHFVDSETIEAFRAAAQRKNPGGDPGLKKERAARQTPYSHRHLG
ncbi:hypothetical protein [Burkholderia plantarii]|uniref:hypothetical protein n=1 Tax=Burkholderia plantarii TaxID=41899 RepID=UPI0018DD0359|nr:hypothetical protein [Burkholderia plantarii]MBI0330168.1 hypothetical protein [Burkholderia plantarii]